MNGLAKLYFGWSAYFAEQWPEARVPEAVKDLYEPDGLRLLSGSTTSEKVMFILEAGADQDPQWMAGRLKGRLQHFLKQTGENFPGFKRSFLLQSLGQNNRVIVTDYVQSQVDRSDLVDPLYRRKMRDLQFHREGGNWLSTSHRGNYDLLLHLVLVTGGRHRMFAKEAKETFEALREGSMRAGTGVFDISMMPDHAHLVVGWPSDKSASEVIEGVKTASGARLRRTAFWNAGGCVGTVGAYKLRVAVEKNRLNGGW